MSTNKNSIYFSIYKYDIGSHLRAEIIPDFVYLLNSAQLGLFNTYVIPKYRIKGILCYKCVVFAKNGPRIQNIPIWDLTYRARKDHGITLIYKAYLMAKRGNKVININPKNKYK